MKRRRRTIDEDHRSPLEAFEARDGLLRVRSLLGTRYRSPAGVLGAGVEWRLHSPYFYIPPPAVVIRPEIDVLPRADQITRLMKGLLKDPGISQVFCLNTTGAWIAPLTRQRVPPWTWPVYEGDYNPDYKVRRVVNVVFLTGNRDPSRNNYFTNFLCGVGDFQRPDGIEGLANNPPTQEEGEAWFNANFQPVYTAPTNYSPSLEQALRRRSGEDRTSVDVDVERFNNEVKHYQSNRTVVFYRPTGNLEGSNQSTSDVYLIRAFFNSRAPMVGYAINPGVVRPVDMYVGSFTSFSCPDPTVDQSAVSRSLHEQIVALGPTNSRYKWAMSDEPADAETIDPEKLLELVKPLL